MRRIGALATFILHAILGAALLSYEPSRQALFSAVPLMVDLITPPKIDPVPPVEIPPPPAPKPKPTPKIEPRPVIKQPEPPPPIVTAPVEAPAPVEVAPPPPPPPPEPAPIIAPAPPPAPVTVTPPIFSADYLRNPPPDYPALSRRLREEGRVVLRVLVETSGKAGEIELRESSGHARLDRAAREAVARWKFVPARRGDTPVAAWVLIPVSFRLEG